MDQTRERARYLHYSLRTEKAYLYWIRWFIRWHGLRHPRDMGVAEVEAFLSMLATERHVSSSTHNQALSAVLFLYREVLGQTLPWMDNLKRPAHTRRIPVVLTHRHRQARVRPHAAPQLRDPPAAIGHRHPACSSSRSDHPMFDYQEGSDLRQEGLRVGHGRLAGGR